MAETFSRWLSSLWALSVSPCTGEAVMGNGGYSVINQVTPFGVREVKEDPVLGRLVELGRYAYGDADKYKGAEAYCQRTE